MAREWQTALKREVPTKPTLEEMIGGLDHKHAEVLAEEMIELLGAMGFKLQHKGTGVTITEDDVQVVRDPDVTPDIVKIAHESTDVCYITETTAAMYGFAIDPVFAEIHASNMTRIDADGNLLRHPSRNPSLTYRAPNVVRAMLFA